MPRRAFTPDALSALEDRVVPSAVVSGLRFNMALQMVRGDFELFATSGNFDRLRTMLAQSTAGLPFHQADALGAKTNTILAQMEADLAAGVPGAVSTAYHRVVGGIRADVQGRIDNGTLVVGP